MKRGENFVIIDFGGCTKRKMTEDGTVEFFPKRRGTLLTQSSWEISSQKGLKEDRAAFTRLAPTSVPAIQLSHISWFLLMKYAESCSLTEVITVSGDTFGWSTKNNHLCSGAKRIFRERRGGGDDEERIIKIQKDREWFYNALVTPEIQAYLADTLELKMFEILRPYISNPNVEEETEYWRNKIIQPTRQTWEEYKGGFLKMSEDVDVVPAVDIQFEEQSRVRTSPDAVMPITKADVESDVVEANARDGETGCQCVVM